MRFIKQLSLWLLASLVLVLGLWFAMENGQSVRLNAWGVVVESLSLGVLLPLVLLLGLILGVLVSLFPMLKLRARLLRAERQANKINKELNQLRIAGAKSEA